MSKHIAKILFFMRFSPLIFKYHPEIKHRNKAFKGSIKFEVTKSRRSKRVLPKILKCSKIPKDSVVGIAIKDMITNKSAQAFVLEILNLSIREAHGPSIMLIPEVSAALKSKMKNAQATIFP